MIEELREEAIVKKIGGGSSSRRLIQKRLVQLNAGARPLVDTKTDNKMQIVINEIMQDKIYLDTEMNVQVAAGPAGPPLDVDFREPMKGRELLDRRHRRDRGLQDRGPGEPIGAGRGRRDGGHDPLGHAAGRAKDVRGAHRPAGRARASSAPAAIRTSSWPSGPSCSASPPPRPTSWPRPPADWPTIC